MDQVYLDPEFPAAENPGSCGLMTVLGVLLDISHSTHFSGFPEIRKDDTVYFWLETGTVDI